jgi:hypothetical protein
MSTSVARDSADRHRTLRDIKPKAVKALLTNGEISADEADFRDLMGKAVERAILLCGWSVKEAADRIRRDRAQVSRWMAGTERPQFDALFAVPELRGPLVIALAEATGEVADVTTTVTIRRTV